MSLKKGKEYLDSVEKLNLEAHMLGKKTGQLGKHGLVKPSQKAVAFTFDAAHDQDTKDLFRVKSIIKVQKKKNQKMEL